jgi:hypothetical protein
MLKFSEHQQIDEFFNVRTLFAGFVAKLKMALSRLGFGRKVSISLGQYIMKEEIDLKSRLGYLSEYSTAMELAKVLEANNCKVTQRSTVAETTRVYNQKKAELVRLKAPAAEIQRQESAGKVMGEQIFKDIIASAQDLPLLTFDIEMTGDSGKGTTKADLILHITKDSEKQVIDQVMASLKAYKSSSINLSNSTFISLIKTLFYDNPAALPRLSEDFIVKFAKDYGSMDEMRELLRLQNIIGAEMKAGASKADARTTAKATHGDVIEVIAKIFKKYYPSHKKEMNERMLKMLGFDGHDDFYAAVGTPGKMGIISSRESRELQNLMKKFEQGFNLSIERNGTTNNANINFTGPDGKVFIKGTITFADTGGKNPQGKTNTFVDFKKFMRK